MTFPDLNANPFQNAYLLRYNFQPSPDKAGTPDSLTTGPVFESFLEDFQRNRQRNARTLRKDSAGGEGLQQMAAQLFRQEQERSRLELQVSQLEQQLDDPRIQTDPNRRRDVSRLLDTRKDQLTSDDFGLSGLRIRVSQGAKGLSSGFVGSENRVDAIGSFVVSL